MLRSGEAEALALFDCPHHSLLKDFLRLVLRQVQLVEAGVAGWQAHWVVCHDSADCKQLNSVHSLQLVKTFNGHLGAASDELQEVALLGAVKGLHELPEPFDLRGSFVVPSVACVPLEIGDWKRNE